MREDPGPALWHQTLWVHKIKQFCAKFSLLDEQPNSFITENNGFVKIILFLTFVFCFQNKNINKQPKTQNT